MYQALLPAPIMVKEPYSWMFCSITKISMLSKNIAFMPDDKNKNIGVLPYNI